MSEILPKRCKTEVIASRDVGIVEACEAVVLRDYIDDYYHVTRSHQRLDADTPIPQEKAEPVVGPTKLISTPVVGGLHHSYSRVAA